MSGGRLSDSDRRVLLWLCSAAVCWRWFVSLRVPAPAAETCHDLWLAEHLAAGDWSELAALWWRPLHALLVAPALAFGAPSLPVAQVIACVFGGLAVAPAAIAAERLRTGAGVAAGSLVMVQAGAVAAAGAGAATGVYSFVVACSLWAWGAGRTVVALLLAAIATAAGCGALAGAASGWFDELRLATGAALLWLPLLVWRPQPRRLLGLAIAFAILVAVAVSIGASSSLMPVWSPLLAVLVGVGLARLPLRVRDLLLAAVVAVDCHAAWTLLEPPVVAADRLLGGYLARRVLAPSDLLISDARRVLWAAGRRPIGVTRDELVAAIGRADAACLVLGPAFRSDRMLRDQLESSYRRLELPRNLQDLVIDRGCTVLVRR